MGTRPPPSAHDAPCVAGATGNIGVETVALTVSFAVGAAIPLLVFALAGRRIAERVQAFQRHTTAIRTGGGIVVILLAVALAFNVPAAIQRLLPDYTGALQQRIDSSETVREALDLGGLVTDENRELSNCSNGAPVLEDCGTAPEIRGIDRWLNTPDGEALQLEALRGQVVLVDFWTYSCINCQRSIPHLNAWYDRYADVGEGGYENTAKLIRELLADADPGVDLPEPTTVQDATPLDEITPETYFSIKRVINYAGEPRYAAGRQEFTLADEQKQDTFSLGGTWEVDFQGARSVSDDARVRLAYRSADVFVVLGGEGTVESTVTTGGRSTTTSIGVSGNPRLSRCSRATGRPRGWWTSRSPRACRSTR